MNKFNYLKDTHNIIILAILLLITIVVGSNNYFPRKEQAILYACLTVFFLYFVCSPLSIKPKPLKERTLELWLLIIIGFAITIISVGSLYKFQAIGIITIISSALYLLFRKEHTKKVKKQSTIIKDQLRSRVLLTAIPVLIDVQYNITSMFLSEYYFWIGITAVASIINLTHPLLVKAFKK